MWFLDVLKDMAVHRSELGPLRRPFGLITALRGRSPPGTLKTWLLKGQPWTGRLLRWRSGARSARPGPRMAACLATAASGLLENSTVVPAARGSLTVRSSALVLPEMVLLMRVPA